jgi:hypothetical protein
VLANKYVAALIGVLLILVVTYDVRFLLSRGKHREVAVAKKSYPSGHPHDRTYQSPEPGLEKEDMNPWKRDPFGLKATEKTAEERAAEKLAVYRAEIRVMGIIKRDGRSYALINGKVYTVNDRLRDAVIEEIKKHSIVLASEGIRYEISYNDYVVLKEKKK